MKILDQSMVNDLLDFSGLLQQIAIWTKVSYEMNFY